MSFFIRTFSLYQKKVVIAFIKRTVDHFYHRPDDFGDWCHLKLEKTFTFIAWKCNVSESRIMPPVGYFRHASSPSLGWKRWKLRFITKVKFSILHAQNQAIKKRYTD